MLSEFSYNDALKLDLYECKFRFNLGSIITCVFYLTIFIPILVSLRQLNSTIRL